MRLITLTEFFDTLMLYPRIAIAAVLISLVILAIICDLIIRIAKHIAGSKVKQYEYKTISIECPKPEASAMEILGRDGWEIICCTSIGRDTIYTLKRIKK